MSVEVFGLNENRSPAQIELLLFTQAFCSPRPYHSQAFSFAQASSFNQPGFMFITGLTKKESDAKHKERMTNRKMRELPNEKERGFNRKKRGTPNKEERAAKQVELSRLILLYRCKYFPQSTKSAKIT